MNVLHFVREGFVEIREHAGRTFLQTLGVILGVASVVATMGMTAGMEAQRQAYFRDSGGGLLMGVYNRGPQQLELTASQRARLGLDMADVDAIRRGVEGLDLVVAQYRRRHQVRAGGTQMELAVRGVEPQLQRLRKLDVDNGRFLTSYDMESSEPVVVLGSTRARELFGSTDPVGRRLSIGGVTYTVVGVMREKVFHFRQDEDYNAYEWMNRLILVPLTTYAVRHLGPETDEVDSVTLKLSSAEVHEETRGAVERLLLARHGVEDFGIWDRREWIEQGNREGQIYNLTFLACGLISLLVGGIVITNIMLASFTERMREVGVRKTLGATGWQVFVQFLVEALVVTVLGGTVGLALGMVFTAGIGMALNIKMVLTPVMIVAAVGSAAAVGLVFGMYPAVRASRLDPVVALRFE